MSRRAATTFDPIRGDALVARPRSFAALALCLAALPGLFSCSKPSVSPAPAAETAAGNSGSTHGGEVARPSRTERPQLPPSASAPERQSPPPPSADEPRNFSDLLDRPAEPPVQRTWPDEQLRVVGLRRVTSKHVTLYTDVPPDEEVDALPAVFDQAVPLWGAYFDVPPEKTDAWRLNAFLMKGQAAFAALDMLPGEREIATGFATRDNLWVNEQSPAYYRRHLWLHEGTHAFMHAFLDRTSPGWYMEGVAELLGTHRWHDGRLEIGVMPRSSKEVPALGRIELVQRDVDQGLVHAIDDIMQIDNRRALSSEVYAWCWALARFLDSHPRYRERFRTLSRTGADAGFAERFREAYADDWYEMRTEWAIFAATLSYDHRIEPTVLDFEPGRQRAEADRPVVAGIRADRGWQNSGIELEGGATYRIAASGRYQVDDEPQPWWCEPNGVTIHYNRGRPLGIVLAALMVRTPEGQPQPDSFVRPLAIGLERTVTPELSGTLYLRINDSPGSLHDNQGELTIEVARQ